MEKLNNYIKESLIAFTKHKNDVLIERLMSAEFTGKPNVIIKVQGNIERYILVNEDKKETLLCEFDNNEIINF